MSNIKIRYREYLISSNIKIRYRESLISSNIKIRYREYQIVANVYLHIMETLFLTIHKPLYYSRYIDDIFIIVANNFDILILTNT